MNQSFPLGSVLGIPVALDRSWFIIFILMTWLMGTGYYPIYFPHWPVLFHWAMGAITALGLFASVFLHELGHSVIALWFKVPVHGITLFLFGGVAHLGREPPGPKAEFLIAIAGPLVSLLLAVMFWFLQPYIRFSEPLIGLFHYLALINFSLFVFNLIPGYPLDGGRVFRAIVWRFTHSLRRSTYISAQVGRIFGGIFIAYGAWETVTVDLSGLWMVMIGWFLYTVATQAAVFNRD